MNFKFLNIFRKKSVGLNSLLDYFDWGSSLWSGTSYYALAREGYAKNVVAYHCITQIAQAVANLPILIKINEKEDSKGEIAKLFKNPSPRQNYQAFMNQIVINLLIAGNAYVLGIPVSTGRVMTLQALRPDRVTIQSKDNYIPYQYTYNAGNRIEFYPVDPITLESEMIQIKCYNPLDDIYGLSPIAIAMREVETHNESTEWNMRLLRNSGVPKGVLAIKGEPGQAPISNEQLERINKSINEKIAGSKNAGKIPIVDFMMEWKNMGFSPADMEWIQARTTSARDICLAFGYPAYLLGMPEGATFTNVAEAKLSLYEETVIPLAEKILSELARYLEYYANLNGKSKNMIDICVDKDGVTALTPRRFAARQAAREDFTAGIISLNEARAEGGYEPWDGGDQIFVPATKLPLDFDMSEFSKEGNAEK